MEELITRYKEKEAHIAQLKKEKLALKSSMDVVVEKIIIKKHMNHLHVKRFVVGHNYVKLWLDGNITYIYENDGIQTFSCINFKNDNVRIRTNITYDGWDAPVNMELTTLQQELVRKRKELLYAAVDARNQWTRYNNSPTEF